LTVQIVLVPPKSGIVTAPRGVREKKKKKKERAI
jgi:hypothetical protein